MDSMIISIMAFVLAFGLIAYFQRLFRRSRSSDLQLRLALPSSESAGSARANPDSDASRPDVRWYERLFAIVFGACMGGFLFVVLLSNYLSPPRRPVVPEVTLGYTHFFKAKFGSVYGTYFEYLAITYGVWVLWGGGVLIGACVAMLKIKINENSLTFTLFFWAGRQSPCCFATRFGGPLRNRERPATDELEQAIRACRLSVQNSAGDEINSSLVDDTFSCSSAC